MAVDGPGHLAVVDRKGLLAEDLLHHKDRLGKTDVAKLRRRRQIADREHARRPSCASIRPRRTWPRSSSSTPVPSASKPVGERAPADRHHDRLDLELLAIAEVHGRVVAVRLVAVHHDAGAHGHPAPGERPYDDVGHIRVAAREDLRQRLQQGDLDTEIDQHARRTRSRWRRLRSPPPMRELAESQHLVRGLDVAAVHVKSGQRPRHRSRRQHDVLGAEVGSRPPRMTSPRRSCRGAGARRR